MEKVISKVTASKELKLALAKAQSLEEKGIIHERLLQALMRLPLVQLESLLLEYAILLEKEQRS